MQASKTATKWYRYTRLNTDGTREEICRRNTPMDLDQMRTELGCDILQLIPREYYEGKEWAHGQVQVYGNDEGRVPGYKPNQNFHTLEAPEHHMLAYYSWDVPGDCLLVDRVDVP